MSDSLSRLLRGRVRPVAATQTRRKRRVGLYLKELRERATRTADEAADFLEVKRQTITRMEAGESLCRRRDLSALVAWYGGTDAERAEALRRWDDAKQDTTRIVLPGAIAPQLRSYLRSEADASVEKITSVQAVHGLLQTFDYAAAIHAAPSGFPLSDAEIEKYAGARISRQGRLRGPNPVTIHVVMDEAVIRRVVGGREVMREQLAHLASLSAQPNVTLQVAPFDVGAYGTMSGDATILEFPDVEDAPAAYVEYVGGGKWVENADDVARLATTFERVVRAALSPTDTVALFRMREEELSE